MQVAAVTAVERIAKSLESLVHVDEQGKHTSVALTQFHHDSPGLRTLRRQIAECLVALVESDPEAVEAIHKLHLSCT